ncbi:hypothetical protein EV421DRAFT_2012316 [Armillaria borealis]|uniref:Reverse transcriptase zinc-binding domain-containing protein n=1 Tax=Armillaria borealis TaxID=47425 RepID=A0AA39IEM6_9AGAR|nr:hypothetical protein EV421DRAFT_2012316 [Armillaria borealis]
MDDTDSKYVINVLVKSKQRMEDEGYIGVPNATLIRDTVAALRERETETCFNERDFVPQINPRLMITGARLQNMSQKLAYRAIRIKKMRKFLPRRRTAEQLEYAKAAAEDAFDDRPTDARFWGSLKHKDIARNVRYTLWMMAHDAYMVGANWLRPNYKPEFQERAYCKHCRGEIDSLSHILTECESPGQKEIWMKTKLILARRGIQWRTPTVGLLLASGLPTFKSENGKRDAGKERFYRIIMTISIQVIWSLRVKRVVDNESAPFTASAVEKMWLKSVNDRLELDCLMTNKRFGKKALKHEVVKKTWKGVLKDERQLPSNWAGAVGVLVGIGL